MSQKACYFLDILLPNENEPELSVEIGVLRWSGKMVDRPEVYVHSFLRPQNFTRVRWANVASKGILRNQIEGQKLPTIDDMVNSDYLKHKRVVCFNDKVEPWKSLTKNSLEVNSIVTLWNLVFEKNEEALNCQNLQQMLEFVGLPSQCHENHGYTQLLCDLHAMAALWFVLELLLSNKSNVIENAQALCEPLWPLPQVPQKWFENNPQSFKDLSKEQVLDFFSENLAHRLNWTNLSIFAYDWVYNRPNRQPVEELEGFYELSDYIFNKMLTFRVRLWILIFFTVFGHKIRQAREVALNNGRFEKLSPAVRDNFSHFVISHLDDFLDDTQKRSIIHALIKQSLQKRSKATFESFNFDEISKMEDSRRYFCDSFGPEDSNIKCVFEIRDAMQSILYRRYIITGQGQEREMCAEFLNQALHSFMIEVKNSLSSFWFSPELQVLPGLI